MRGSRYGIEWIVEEEQGAVAVCIIQSGRVGCVAVRDIRLERRPVDTPITRTAHAYAAIESPFARKIRDAIHKTLVASKPPALSKGEDTPVG
jgi:hypothetical protein